MFLNLKNNIPVVLTVLSAELFSGENVSVKGKLRMYLDKIEGMGVHICDFENLTAKLLSYEIVESARKITISS